MITIAWRMHPTAGYVPGQTYDLEISWANPIVSHAMHVEFVDHETGRAAGRVALLEDVAVDGRGRCGSLLNEDRADYLLQADNRQVLGVEGCGASNLRFRFTAPNLPQVVFAGSVVRAGEPLASPAGDGVQSLTRLVKRVGEPNQVASSCAVGAALGACAGRGTLLVVVLAALLRVVVLAALLRARARGRRYKKLSPSIPVNSSTPTDGSPTNSS